MPPVSTPTVRIGLEQLLDSPPARLAGKRLGLLMNQASVDAGWQYASDRMAERFPGQLTALFAPQHGLWCEQQANMIETPHEQADSQLPVFSLYSETREPTPEMLQSIDYLVIDLQDVGTRVYTFIWTVLKCLQACTRVGIPVLVLDRPNPLGGDVIEGPLLDPDFTSFVGLAEIPMRHALTIGEIARLVNAELRIGADLEVIPMAGWRRSMLFPETGRSWTPPSPNMPRFETAVVYPGQVLLEGTNLSEGRGTTIPFELVGAPYLDPRQLVRELDRWPHPGIVFRPVRFVPTFDKWKGERCGGVAWHVPDPTAARSFVTTLSVLAAARWLAPEAFSWLPPPYEYETEKMPIDILYGSARLREAIAGDLDPEQLRELAAVDATAWRDRTDPYRLYDAASG